MSILRLPTNTFEVDGSSVVQASMTLAQAEAYARGIDTDAHPALRVKYFDENNPGGYREWPNGTGA